MGKPVSEKADIYAFAVVFWEMLTGQEPFAEHDSYQSFVDAICKQRERPPLPADMHVSVSKLLTDCWAHEPDQRPSFTSIIQRLADSLVSVSLPDDASARMWKANWPDQVGVSWTKFIPIFYKACNEPLQRDRENSKEYKVLRAILLPDWHKEGDDETITLERFGLLTKWFGTLVTPQGSLLKRIEETARFPYFFGDIDRVNAESLLSAFAKRPGTFLVRLSTTEPIERTPFTVSKVSSDGSITHTRVNFRTDGRGYFISVKTKSGNLQIEAPCPFSALVEKAKKKLKLREVAPGSKFIGLFKDSGGQSAYLPPADDSDSD